MPIFTPVDFNPFAEAQEIEKIIYTNEAQKEIWLACIVGGEEANLSYNESASLEIKGDLNFAAFTRAVEDLVLRHEALRATISPNGEMLVLYKNFPIDLKLTDISDLAEAEMQTELHTFLRREIDTQIDIYNGPLFKVFMHKTGTDAWFFTIIKHHIIGDGWSTGIILEDLGKMYSANKHGITSSLDAPSQISDYASWQANFKLTDECKKAKAYWLELYKNNIPLLDLPTDRARRSPRSFKGRRIDQPMSATLASQIKAAGAKAGTSLVTTLLAAFEVFLYKKTQQTDIVVGLPASGQAASGLTSVVGNCVNLLPLRSHISPDLPFSEYLKKRKKEVLDAYDHQNLTFGELIRKLYIPRDASRIPLVPVIFNIDMGMDNAVAFDGLDIKLISNPRAYENFEIFLNATRSKDDMVLEWSYNTDLFNAATIEDYNNDYISLLENIVASPDTSIASLTGVQQSSANTNFAGEILIPDGKNLISLFEAAAINYADKTAVSYQQSSITYGQLNQKANQLCSFLIEKGIGRQDIVGLLADRSIEMVISLLAILKAGAAYLPLDPIYPAERIAYMLEDSSAKMVLVSQPYKGKYKTGATEIVIDDQLPNLTAYNDKNPKENIESNGIAYVIYTSGSTGKPKGVKITHLNLVNFLLSMQKVPGISASDRLLALTTVSFDIAGLELYLPLISGAEVIIAGAEAVRDGRQLVSLIVEKDISIVQATPSSWQMLVDSGLQQRDNLKALSGGEPLPKELAGKLLTLTASLWNVYGPTETTIWSTIKQILPGEEQITIGLPIDNTQIYIIDEHGKPLPTGDVGEIYIGGYGVAQGYLNRPELTAEKFVANALSNSPDAKLYRTGDLGKILANGEIQCLGRIDNQVKIRGYRIELGEIESSLSAQKGVKQSVVVAFDDALLNKYLVAFVITDSGDVSKLEEQLQTEWRNKLAEKLPDYMVPEEFVSIDKFPLTPNGKIDRKAFVKPARKHSSTTSNGDLPVSANEKLIARIFSENLGLTDIKLSDDFFKMGGHSLLAVKVMVAIERETGERLPLATFFDNSTVKKLAARLADNNPEGAWDTIVPIKTSGQKPPLFLVHGSGLNVLNFKTVSENFDDTQPFYGVQAIGLSKPAEMPDTVEAIATYHLSEILKVDPEGPYTIAGYSYGGFIAYEIVKQLIQSGKRVNFFGVIDTNARAAMQPQSKTTRLIEKVIRQFHKLPFFIGSFIKHPKEAFEYQKYIFGRKLSKHNPDETNKDIEKYTEYENQIRDKYNTVMDRYIIRPFDIKVSLFRVQKRLYFLDDPKYLGWKKLALKGVKIYDVPGDHKTFLEPPNDKSFARIIQQALDSEL
ncbi:amino acid adenylation domain-containing protein [Mucilaginibacter calamicampi]|uniref:Amino acid adenylation domain-containing protein n=1 Tax=Mucilaginibacter calamicampi TaxID=1302352 RepID=A0ABW2YZT6_9SPHI